MPLLFQPSSLWCASATSLKFSWIFPPKCSKSRQNRTCIWKKNTRAVLVHSACIIKPSCARNFSAGHVIFRKNYTKLPQILRSFSKQYKHFQPFKSDLNTFNIQGECNRTIFKQNKTYSAIFHGFIAWGIDSTQRMSQKYTIYAWGGITRMVKRFIGVLLIHIKRVLSMVSACLLTMQWSNVWYPTEQTFGGKTKCIVIQVYCTSL